jgi:hypothetical protein
MRRHSLLPRYAPFVEPARFARVVHPRYLVAARVQPSYYEWGEAWMDLVFARDGEFALVPFVQIDPQMILVREASPLIWPSWLPFEIAAVDEMEALLEPWLVSHALLASLDEEILGFFTDDTASRATFEAARSARFLCATSAESVLLDAAPYVYAQRFASGRRVGIRDPRGALGASLLAQSASGVHADLGDSQLNALARSWYGIGVYGEIPAGSFDVSIGPLATESTVSIAFEQLARNAVPIEVARPIFPMLACTFDPADSSPARSFNVRAREPILRPNRMTVAPIIGGSEGQIAVVIRDDGLIAPDADTDQARALVDALVAQGFDARLTVASAARAETFDLIHLFGHRHVQQFAYVLEEAKRLGVPIVSTPLFDDFGNESLWGTGAVRSMLAGIRDDATQKTIEKGLADRRLLVHAEAERGKPAYDEMQLRAMLAQSRSAIFASRAEEAEVRSRFGFAGSSRLMPAVPSIPVDPQPIGALCGLDEYVLVHASVEPRANQWIAVRAAAEIGVACVLVGTVEHAEYYQSVLESSGSKTMWLPEPCLSAGQLEALYAGARVYADLSWAGHGAARLVRAASHGTMPVLSTALGLGELWPEVTGGVDPASLESAVSVMRQAWMRAPAVGYQIAERTAELCDPLRSLQAVLGAYAEAAGVKAV